LTNDHNKHGDYTILIVSEQMNNIVNFGRISFQPVKRSLYGSTIVIIKIWVFSIRS